MKLAKRFLTAGVALALTLGLNIPAFAAPLGTGEGSITITNATVGESYTIYKIFDTDSTGAGSITATEAQKNFYVGKDNNPFEFTKNTAGSYNVTIGQYDSNADGEDDTTYSADQVIDFLQSFVTEGEDGNPVVDTDFAAVVDASSATTANSATVDFDHIPYGYYFVTSSLGAVVTVDSTDPDQDIIDKNQDGGSSFTKKVAGTDEVVEIGDEFKFTLEFKATNYDGDTKITQYMITDSMDAALDLVYNQGDQNYGVTVNVGENTVNDATVTYTPGVDGADDTLTINIPWVDSNGDSKYTSPSTVTVTYTAELNDTAAIQEDITNNAKLTWTGNETGTETEETVQTYALAIMKVDEEGKPLANATFTVKQGDNDVKVSPVANQSGVYVVDPDGEGASSTVVSPASGLIVIKGVDNVTYTLTETEAPAGYNLLVSPVTVTPTKDGSTTITIYKDEQGNITGTQTETQVGESVSTGGVPVTSTIVVNEAGTTLPSTGGMGTTVLYIAGAVLVLGAGITLVVRRRMNSDR